jgi:pyrimidine-nucleoside phosphorylase
MRTYDLILKKRNGEALSAEEIRFFIQGFTKGEIPDYQASALMMAIYFRGMTQPETHALVEAMVHSGEVIDLSSIRGIKVDKHSTGGVGDKTSIVLGPLVAAAGVPVAKMSGRGLGHTGGTLDKLESFAGFQCEMAIEKFIDQVNRIGIAIAGQTANLAPADKKLYALRDVTATVENLSLIAGSIMSKKLACGADAIVLDVKYGDGAFMKTPDDAKALAQEMVDIGRAAGKRMVAFITGMEEPLGRGIGNSVEVIEAIETLQGKGPADLTELCLSLGAEMVVLGGKAASTAEARQMLTGYLHDGTALRKLRELVKAQGGDPAAVDQPSLLPMAPLRHEVKSPVSGHVHRVHAEAVGRASMKLGAGRETKDSVIDLGAGILLHAKVGQHVQAGEVIATLLTSDASRIAEAEAQLIAAYEFGEEALAPTPLILGRIG